VRSPRILLILFGLAFLVIQVASYMSGITKHEERVVKLEKQAIQYETKGTYIDLKLDPALELRKERTRFKAETVNFVIKVLIIAGSTVFVFALMRDRGERET